MKRISLIIFLTLISLNGFSNSFFNIWGGAGLATRYNYDMGFSGGFTYIKAATWRLGLGASVFYQQYNLYYDRENSQLIGSSIRHNSSYAFVSPVLDLHLGRRGNTHFYVTAGAGFNMGAADSLHKWAKGGYVNYDSTIGKAENINKMVFRFGMGLVEYFSINRRYFISVNEDFGYLSDVLSKTNNPTDAMLNRNVNQLYTPTYISVRLGIIRGYQKKR